MLMNYFRHIDRDRIMFDFLTHRPWKADYDDEIEELGGKVYHAPRLYPQNYPAYFRYMRRFFNDHPEYRIVHSHIDAMSYLPLTAAKHADIPVRIAHSHNTSIDPDLKYLLKTYYRHRLPSVATDYLACGTEAGEFLFGDRPFTVIPNAIDTSLFVFNQETREKVRAQLQLDNRFVIGSVGRLTYQKNLGFLLDVFQKLVELSPDSLLLVIGGGEEEEALKKQAAGYGITDKVLFLGIRNDVNQLYQAMDVFVMPSRYEGLPVVGVEAQCSGLPCVFSANITRELKMSERAIFLDIDCTAEEWARFILGLKGQTDSRAIPHNCLEMDIERVKDRLQDYYLEKWGTV
jgi:glycosyltransferase involved in cell wall biosynthesis